MSLKSNNKVTYYGNKKEMIDLNCEFSSKLVKILSENDLLNDNLELKALDANKSSKNKSCDDIIGIKNALGDKNDKNETNNKNTIIKSNECEVKSNPDLDDDKFDCAYENGYLNDVDFNKNDEFQKIQETLGTLDEIIDSNNQPYTLGLTLNKEFKYRTLKNSIKLIESARSASSSILSIDRFKRMKSKRRSISSMISDRKKISAKNLLNQIEHLDHQNKINIGKFCLFFKSFLI